MTPEQQKHLARTQAAIGPAIIDRYPLLVEFLDEIGLSDTENVVQNVNVLVPDFAHWLDLNAAKPDDAADRMLMVSLFIGEIFCQRWSGCWLLNDKPDSPNFGSYVVGKFKKLTRPAGVVNPFLVATEYLEERIEKGAFARSFEQVIAAVEADLQRP